MFEEIVMSAYFNAKATRKLSNGSVELQKHATVLFGMNSFFSSLLRQVAQNRGSLWAFDLLQEGPEILLIAPLA